MIRRLVVLALCSLVSLACGGSGEDAAGTTSVTAAGASTTDDGEAASAVSAPGTLRSVIERGELVCGVSGATVGFSELQPDGSVTGFDADYCRAVAAAVLGDAEAVRFRPLTGAERFDVLEAGEVDVLFRNTTSTQENDAGTARVDFGPPIYHDGQQLMGLSARFGPGSGPADLDRAILCANAGTSAERAVTAWATRGEATIRLEPVSTFPEAVEKLKAGACHVVTGDGTVLTGAKVTEEELGTIDRDTWVIFPPRPLSNKPLAPVYREDDSEWADVIDWVVYATIIADQKGITSQTVGDRSTWDREATRLFGGEGELQSAMGLDATAFLRIIEQVGNYDEIFTRNLTPVGLSREEGSNAQFSEGGLIHAPPAR